MLHFIDMVNDFCLEVVDEEREFSQEIVSAVAAEWERNLLSRPGNELFNGKILDCISCDRCLVRARVVDYKYWFAQRRIKELAEVIGIKPIAVSGMLCLGNEVVVGKRSVSVCQCPSMWELMPSGGVDANFSCNSRELIKNQVYIELEEELGIARDFVVSTYFDGACYDDVEMVYDFLFRLDVDLSFSEVFDKFKLCKSSEYESIALYSQERDDCRYNMVPLSRLWLNRVLG